MTTKTTTPKPEPVPQSLTQTPAGIEIAYFLEPKRSYAVRRSLPASTEGGAGFQTEWVEVPSVTTVLGCLDKPALPYWGNKIGADGVLELVRLGELVMMDDGKDVIW